MARQWRIEHPGALYHVLSRGNGQQDIFLSDTDRVLFLDLIQEFSDRFAIEVYAFVLMDNHYHLLLTTLDANLSKGMQWFGTAYTRKFNLNNNRCGHLFLDGQRYGGMANHARLPSITLSAPATKIPCQRSSFHSSISPNTNRPKNCSFRANGTTVPWRNAYRKTLSATTGKDVPPTCR